MAHIMCYADEIDIAGGYCDICGAVPSKYSLRLEDNKPAKLNNNGQVILLDGEYGEQKITYKAICDKCFKEIYG